MTAIISREDAWQIWQPYGERGLSTLDGAFNAITITPPEAVAALYGAEESEVMRAFDIASEAGFGLSAVRKTFETGAPAELIDLILASNARQNATIRTIREQIVTDGPAFVEDLGRAVMSLATEGYWTSEQAAMIRNRLHGPDGQPYFQDLPMTGLEAIRFTPPPDDAPPLETVRIDQGLTQLLYIPQSAAPLFNRVHENVHVPISGVELYCGSSGPTRISVGLVRDGFSSDIGVEENEGWTQDVSIALKLATQGLRHYFIEGVEGKSKGDYWPWVKQVRELHSKYTRTYRAMVGAALVDATPQEPDAKIAALARLNSIADSELDMKHAIRVIFEAELKHTDLPHLAPRL